MSGWVSWWWWWWWWFIWNYEYDYMKRVNYFNIVHVIHIYLVNVSKLIRDIWRLTLKWYFCKCYNIHLKMPWIQSKTLFWQVHLKTFGLNGALSTISNSKFQFSILEFVSSVWVWEVLHPCRCWRNIGCRLMKYFTEKEKMNLLVKILVVGRWSL